MARVRVEVARGGAPEPELLEFTINDDRPDFEVRTEPIAAWSVADIPERHLDLIDIAAAVFATDGMVLRGGSGRANLGAAWTRRLSFEIEVRDRTFWNRANIRAALKDTVEFLTEDEVTFEFVQAANWAPKQSYLQFTGAASKRFAADHVVLFSGGLDSLAGALETLAHEPGRVVLVTHRSAQKNTSGQNRLAEALKASNPGRVAYVPIRATRKGERARETTQRSRSFLFAAFGYVIAQSVGADRLSFHENGVVSQNLPLSPQIIGTMATRTTHPHTLKKFADLLSLVGGKPFEVRNPFQWITKKEVVEKIRYHGRADLIASTVSCNHVWKRTAELTHCGACSQCLDRRFGVLGAGLAEFDPETRYRTPVLTGERTTTLSKTEALEWTRHALRLSDMTIEEFQERFGGEVARIARGHPTLVPSDILQRSLDLQRRHGANVRRVIEAEIAARAAALLDRSLPETSLFRMVVSERSGGGALPEVTAADLAQLVGSGEDLSAEFREDVIDERTVVILRVLKGRPGFTVHGLGEIDGAPAGPFFALHPQFETDRSEGRIASEHRYVQAGDMTPIGGRSASAVVQNVKRCREELGLLFEAINGEPPCEPILIQNRHGRGYRLDPTIVVIDQRR